MKKTARSGPSKIGLFLAIVFAMLLGARSLWAQTAEMAEMVTAYPDIPRIDVHTHLCEDPAAIANYLEVRDLLQKEHQVDLALWIDLGLGKKPIQDHNAVFEKSKGRVLCCISDYFPHRGLRRPPEELSKCLEQGFIGYKIWAGPASRRNLKPEEKVYPHIDNMANDPTFAKMEEIGMIAASLHIADPNGPFGDRRKYFKTPPLFWKEIVAFTNLMERHPNLKVVGAHGLWLLSQDAQIDYLRYLLATYPNLYVDLSATFQYFHWPSRDNLRAFMIEWSDRILFGTDAGNWTDAKQNVRYPSRYFRCFALLESDKMVPRGKGGYWGSKEDLRGLNLPREVLEKIYYKNAMRVYPRVKEQMEKLGYDVD